MERISKGFFTGVNYWGSKDAINMWENFDEASIEADLKVLSDCGITHLRVFPLWPVFQPLKSLYGPQKVYEYGLGEAPLPDTEAGRAGVSEEACQKFEIFCKLCEKYNLKLIVALITGHMSFRLYTPPAFEGMDLLSDPTVMKWQRRFVKYFVKRFKSSPAIVGWDLGNEVNSLPGLENKPKDTFYVWCAYMADAIRTVDNEHPVISGIDNSAVDTGISCLKDSDELFDIHTTHPYQIFATNTEPLCSILPICDLPFRCQISEDIAGIPTFVQEFSSLGYANCSQNSEAEFYRASLFTSLAHGFYGTMWWCAFDQGEFDYAPYRWNTIGSNYGFFDRKLTPKPLAEVNRSFTEFVNKLPSQKLPPHKKEACVIVPRETEESSDELNKIMRATYVLTKQANFDVSFSYALDPIPDSKLYIFTGLTHHKTITKQRLDELLKKVEEGAVLYLSLDEGLFRDLPQFTGVDFKYRYQVNKEKNIILNDNVLPVFTRYFYQPENSKAEIVARCDSGEPVLFKYNYGKGLVYLLTLPLERHIANASGVFFKENMPVYNCLYRELAKAAGIERICDSDNPHLRLTEHQIDENNAYIFAINYSDSESITNITLAENYEISQTVYGNKICDGKLQLKSCDAALFVVTKKGR